MSIRRFGRAAALAVALLAWEQASAQTPVLLSSDAGSSAGKGGGTRPVIFRSGWYLAFFIDGGQVVHRASADGVTFTAPSPASAGMRADLGFSVASAGARVALVWGTQAATQSELWYREGVISGPTITWRGPQLISSSATDLRGYFPLVAFTANGVPVLDALHQQEAYAGPLPGPCGTSNGFRPAPHVARSTLPDGGADFLPIGYCTASTAASEPISLSLAPTTTPLVVHAALLNGSLVTGILNAGVDAGTAELGETDLRGDATAAMGGQLCSAGDLAVPADIHHVYQTAAGAIAYTRQDATRDAGSSLGFDNATVAAAGSWPYIGQPAASGGCHSIAWVEGSAIRMRRFRSAVNGGQGLSSPVTAFATSAAPAALAGQPSAANGPAVLWQEGSSVYFGVLPSAGTNPELAAIPPSAPANGVSPVTVSGGPFADSCGMPLPAGSTASVFTSLGVVVEGDQDPVAPGVQIPIDNGFVSFRLRSATRGTAQVTVLPAQGGRAAQLPVPFAGPPTQLVFTSPEQQLLAGECSAPLVVSLRDSAGAPAYAPFEITVNLTGVTPFSDVPQCLGSFTNQVRIPADAGSTLFSLYSTQAGRHPVTAYAAGLSSASQDVVVNPAMPSAMRFSTGPFVVDAGECSPPAHFMVTDAFGNPSPPTSEITISAFTSSATAELFSDPGCTEVFLPVTVIAPDAGSVLHFRDSTPGRFVISAFANTPPISAAQFETVRGDIATVTLSMAGPLFAGSELLITADVVNMGIDNLAGARLRLEAQGLALSETGLLAVPTIPASLSTAVSRTGVITADAGGRVLVRARLLNSTGAPIGTEASAQRGVEPMSADLGSGCAGGCGAGGAELFAAAALLSLLVRRRRSQKEAL